MLEKTSKDKPLEDKPPKDKPSQEIKQDIETFASEPGRSPKEVKKFKNEAIRDSTEPTLPRQTLDLPDGIQVTIRDLDWVLMGDLWLWQVTVGVTKNGRPVEVDNPFFVEPVLLHVHPGGEFVQEFFDEKGNLIETRNYDVDQREALLAVLSSVISDIVSKRG